MHLRAVGPPLIRRAAMCRLADPYDRWLASFELATSAANAEVHAAALTAIERDARPLGERELEGRWCSAGDTQRSP